MHREFLLSAIWHFSGELPILIFTGSVEPIRVLHQRWRAYIQANNGIGRLQFY
jgi:hypothetical protein